VPKPADARRSSSGLERVFPALREPGFRLLWISTLPGMLAIQMGTVAVGYAAFVLSGSAVALGGVSLAVGVPMLVLALVGGVVADQFSRRNILIWTQSTLGLSAAAIAGLAWTNTLELWHLYVYGFVQGTAFSFNMPARQAFIADLVAPELMRSAINLNNATMNFGRIAGPPVAGALLAVPALGIGGVYAVIASMYVFVLIALVRLPEGQPRVLQPGRGGWQQLLEGLAYIRARPPLLALLTLGFVPLFFGMPYQTLLPVFAERVHGTGALGLGLMNAAVGVGALAGTLVLAAGTKLGGLGQLQVLLGVGFGVGLIVFGLAPGFAVAIVALGIVGFAFAGYAAVNQTLVMEQTDRELHGRVMSVYLMSFGLLPIATFPQAWVADHIGAETTVIIAGAMAVASVIATALLLPWYRKMT
jgi:MFS family permease